MKTESNKENIDKCWNCGSLEIAENAESCCEECIDIEGCYNCGSLNLATGFPDLCVACYYKEYCE